MKSPVIRFLAILVVCFATPALAHECGKIPLALGPSQSGYVGKLYWERFPARTGKAKGAVFFLAGGPLPHELYHGARSPYALDVFGDYDFYLYDYRGFGCSERIGSPAALKGQTDRIGVDAYARDFVALKRALVGERARVILFGGSFGGMLGSKILAAYPEHVERAILFSSDIDSEWFARGLATPARLLNGEAWDAFFAEVRAGRARLFAGTSREMVLTPGDLEMMAWVYFSQDSAAQAALPGALIDIPALETYAEGLAALSAPTVLGSAVLPYYRCNVFFPRRRRAELRRRPIVFGSLSTEGLVDYFDRVCVPFDSLPEQPFDLRAEIAERDVPVLFWIGDRDMFDAPRAVAHMRGFGPQVEARVVPGWSHDFGPDKVAGIATVSRWIRGFLAR